MRAGPDGRFHLTYCTNIHRGEDWPTVFGALEAHLPRLKAALSPSGPFGVGLRLSARAARELRAGDALESLAAWLDEEGLYVFTLNGFPYGDFHGRRVKERVYAPDWRSPERVRYTLDLAEILARLLPEGMEGSISTSPVSYKPWVEGSERPRVLDEGARRLAEVATALAEIEARTGRLLHVDLEPEPDCLLENAEETVRFFNDHLLRAGPAEVGRRGGPGGTGGERLLLRHVGVCYDTCHFAVEYEEPERALAAFEREGIRIGKVQVSAALRTRPDDPAATEAVLRPFAEETYLHQVVERRADGGLRRYRDLPEAIRHLGGPGAEEWRIHYHVPVFAAELAEGLQSTRTDLARTLDLLMERGDCTLFEVETYTWEVLPPELRVDLGTSIERELRWARERLEAPTGRAP